MLTLQCSHTDQNALQKVSTLSLHPLKIAMVFILVNPLCFSTNLRATNMRDAFVCLALELGRASVARAGLSALA
jgi:hypothetical protein